MDRESTPIPEPVAQLQRQLEQFRSAQPRRTKLPEALWQAAVERARQHGAYPAAHPLRLDNTRLEAGQLLCRSVELFHGPREIAHARDRLAVNE